MWGIGAAKEEKKDEMFATSFEAATRQSGGVPESRAARDREE